MTRVGILSLVATLLALGPSPTAADDHGTQHSAKALKAPTFQRRAQSVIVKHHPTNDAPVWGPRYAPVTVDLFLQIGDRYHGKRVYDRLLELARHHPRRMRIVVRLIDGRGLGHWHAEAALEAHAQGRFFEFLKASFAHPRPRLDTLTQIAMNSGVDFSRIEKARNDQRHRDELRENQRYMQRHRVRFGRPGLLFNGKEPRERASNLNARKLEEQYDSAYARANRLLLRGATLANIYEMSLRELDLLAPPVRVRQGIIDGMRRTRRRNFKAIATPVSGAITSQGRHSRGAAKPRLIIVVYCSFQSRNCARVNAAVDEVREAYADEVRVVFNHFFDENDSRQPSARYAHEAALCAEDQGVFWDFYDYHYRILNRSQRARQMSIRDLKRIASGIGADEEQFLSCVDNGVHGGAVEAAVQLAKRLGVKHTPTVILGGRMYVGTRGRDELMGLVAQELRPGLLEQFAPVESNND